MDARLPIKDPDGRMVNKVTVDGKEKQVSLNRRLEAK
jgi:hypothetical protein